MPAIKKIRVLALIIAPLLMLVAPNAFGQTASSAPLGADQKQAMDKFIGDYLKRNPEVIIEAIQIYQERKQAVERARAKANLIAARDQLEKDPASPVAGNPKGDVTVVEFFDYRCGFCKRVLPVIRQLLESDTKLRYVFKEFPILSPQSRLAASAALAAWKIDKEAYFSFHVYLMSARGALSEKKIMAIAKRAGLDADKLKRAMAAPGIEDQLNRNAELALKLGITGTPGFIIGERVVPGAIDLAQFRKLIAEARALPG